MSDIDLDRIEKEQGGKGLRGLLESTLAEKRELEQRAATLEAEKVIGSNGWTHVTPEDLSGLASDELAEKGAALQQEREQARLEAARSVLAERGLDPDALLSGEARPNDGGGSEGSTWGATRDLGGEPPRGPVNTDNLHGLAAIEAGLRQN